MNTLTRFFERILTKAYHHIVCDDISEYNEDYSHMLYFKNEEKRRFFNELSYSLSKIYFSKKLLTFIMSFDDISFCIRFRNNIDEDLNVNIRLIAESLKELPMSKGNPIFLIGTTEDINSYGWKSIEAIDNDDYCEIYPLIDFENISFYWSKKQDINSFQNYIFSQSLISSSKTYFKQFSSNSID